METKMLKGHSEQYRVVAPNQTDSAAERREVQMRDAIEQVDQDEINRYMVVVVAGKVAANETHPIVAAEWLPPCNELF
jgi:hypothetical protein